MLSIKDICKRFNDVIVFEGFTLTLLKGQVTSIVGPSGSGKSTLLNLIAGIDVPDAGCIEYSETVKTTIGYMMQEPHLLPWRTLRHNALLGLEIQRRFGRAQNKDVDEYFSSFDLAGSEELLPEQASAGMRQRVALVRTLLLQPSLLLLDEPFSNLDFDIKLRVQRRLGRYAHERECTVLLVTHDIDDAVSLSNRVIVLSEKPTSMKADINIDLGLERSDPIAAKQSPQFGQYFGQIWSELRYLDESD